MHRPDARLLTGVAGLAVAALLAFAERSSTQTLVITLVDTLMMACLILFLAAFRELVRLAEGDLEWVTAIVVGAGLVFVGVTIVGTRWRREAPWAPMRRRCARSQPDTSFCSARSAASSSP